MYFFILIKRIYILHKINKKMLDDIIKTKNILPNIILILMVIGLEKYYNSISWVQITCIVGICILVLFYTKASYIIKSLLIVNTLFISGLVLMDFTSINDYTLAAHFFILLAFLMGRYAYKINGDLIFVEVSLCYFLAVLFYPPTIFYILLIYSLMLFHSVKRFPVWFLPLFCFVMYMGAFLGVSFLLDFDLISYVEERFSQLQLMRYELNMKQWFLLISWALFSLLALFDHYRVAYKQSINNKKDYELIVYFLIISYLLFLLSKNALLFLLFPSSVIIGKYIFYQKNTWVKWIMILYFPISALIFYAI